MCIFILLFIRQNVLFNLYYIYFQFSSNTFIDFIPKSNYIIETEKQLNIKNQEITKLTKELDIEKQKNKNLTKELDLEKQKNINLNNQLDIEKQKNINLTKELDIEKQKNINLNNELDKYKNQVEQLNIEINSLKKTLDSKNLEIQNLANYYNNELKKKSQSTSNLEFCKPGEKIMAVNFISTDENVNLALPCKNTDIFSRLEEQLFNEYPDYKNVNTYFTVDGNTIESNKTMEENNIKNSNVILLNIYEYKIDGNKNNLKKFNKYY